MAIKIARDMVEKIKAVGTESLDRTVITRVLSPWLVAHGDDPLRPDVAQWVADQLSAVKRFRPGSFSGSSAGHCERAQVLAFHGAPVVDEITPQLQQIYKDGQYRHLRIQAQGVMAGLWTLEGLEYRAQWSQMRSINTLDAVTEVPADHPVKEWRGASCGVELKGAMTYVFSAMVDPLKYVNQISRYFLVGGFDLFTAYVENKNMQETREWVFEPDPKRIKEQVEELQRLNDYVDQNTLPPRLNECANLKGPTFKACDYGANLTRPCAMALTVSDVQRMAGAHLPSARSK